MLAQLVGNDKALAAGNFVLDNQVMSEKFRNTNASWVDNCNTFEEGLEQLQFEREKTKDLLLTVGEMRPQNVDGVLKMVTPSGEAFAPTEYALGQLGVNADCGTKLLRDLRKPMTDVKGNVTYTRDSLDTDVAVHIIENGFRRIDPDKKFLFRTHSDHTLRAMLSDSYTCVDNRWFLEEIQKNIPGGLLSHHRGNADTVYTNVLILDSIRTETDSDYGAMLSIGNSEIGERSVSSRPSLYRACCENGCLWGVIKGQNIKRVHRGKIDLVKLSEDIRENLLKQIPLSVGAIDLMLKTKEMKFEHSAAAVLAEVALENGYTKKQGNRLYRAYEEEVNLTPDYDKTVFSVLQSITRSGQQESNENWLLWDEIAGGYLTNGMEKVIARSKHLSMKEVESALAI